MIQTNKAILQALTGGVRLKQRVQHPKIHERKDRGGFYWFFRYRQDELGADGALKPVRKFHTIGPSRGINPLTKKQAELQRDAVLMQLNSAPTRCEVAAAHHTPIEVRAILFGKLAELWLKDYVENPKVTLATPTRQKYRNRLAVHILPRWRDIRLREFRTKEILDWLQNECTSWHMMMDLRNIMSGIFARAQEWEILPETFANPMSRVKLGRKWVVSKDRILTDDETAAVFASLQDPQLLICETCLDTGTRISEALGLQLRHFDRVKGAILIEQRHCRGDVDQPKIKNSKRLLALGALDKRFSAWIEKHQLTRPNEWIFFPDVDHSKPMWDSGVRKALKLAARKAGCDFDGFGLHSFRRSNITIRQEEGGSAIEASKIAGHSSVSQTSDYTIVQLGRQEELTLAIQERRERAGRRHKAASADNLA